MSNPLVEALEREGWSVTNPVTRAISMFNAAGREHVDRAVMLERLALTNDDAAMFQWWLGDEGTDVFYDVSRSPDGVIVHEFDLDGVDPHLNRIEQDVLGLVLDSAARTTGAVFDHNGATEELAWAALMAGADVPIDVVPDLLILSKDLDRLHPDLPYEHRTYELDNLVIHDWDGLYHNESERLQ